MPKREDTKGSDRPDRTGIPDSSDPVLCLDVVDYDSSLYHDAVALRDEILRRPLGLRFSTEDLDREVDDLHCVGTDRDGALLACLVLTPVDDRTVRMRQVAVASSVQRRGFGRDLVRYSESVAQNAGFVEMKLHARDTAIPFYIALGYNLVGPEFVEVGIPHRRMVRTLTPHR